MRSARHKVHPWRRPAGVLSLLNPPVPHGVTISPVARRGRQVVSVS